MKKIEKFFVCLIIECKNAIILSLFLSNFDTEWHKKTPSTWGVNIYK